MAAPFGQAGVGQLILQAAQGIVAQQQQQQRMQLQLLKFEEEVDQQQRVFKLREQEMTIRDRTLKVQEEQNERAAALAPFKQAEAALGVQKTVADIDLTRAKTVSEKAGKGGRGGLTDNQRLRVQEDVEVRSVRLETSQMVDTFDETNGTALPRLGSPQEYLKARRSLQNKVNQFQTSLSAQQATLIQKKLGGAGELEIDKIQQRLDAMNMFIGSDEFTTFRDRIDAEGPRPETRQAVVDKFFAPFANQLPIGLGPAPTPTFDFGTVPSDKVSNSWALFEEGNVEPMADSVLQATGGSFGPDDKSAFETELLRRFPTPGQEQDDAIANWKRMFDRIKAQRIE